MLLQIREELGARLFITQTVLQAGMEDCSIEPKDYGGKAGRSWPPWLPTWTMRSQNCIWRINRLPASF